MKDTWTKTKGVGSREGGGDGCDGGARERKWRQLYLSNHKKIKY